MRTQTHIEFYYPGALVAEAQAIEHRDPRKVDVPRCAFAFRFFDVAVQTATLEDGTTFHHRKTVNKSPMYYPGGVALTADEVNALAGDHEILLSNMRSNGWDKVILTRRGTFHPFNVESTVLV